MTTRKDKYRFNQSTLAITRKYREGNVTVKEFILNSRKGEMRRALIRGDLKEFYALGGYESDLFYIRSDERYAGTLEPLSERQTRRDLDKVAA